jgi:hypothetical protein
MKYHIFVTVEGGGAEVCEDTLPSGLVVEILDFDHIAGTRRLTCLSVLRTSQNTGRAIIRTGPMPEISVANLASSD